MHIPNADKQGVHRMKVRIALKSIDISRMQQDKKQNQAHKDGIHGGDDYAKKLKEISSRLFSKKPCT